MNPSVFGPSDCKANRLFSDGSSLIDCLSCRMRGLSGWFNQVATDGIKKNRWASRNKDVASRHSYNSSQFVLLSCADYNRASFFDYPFSTSGQAQIAILWTSSNSHGN